VNGVLTAVRSMVVHAVAAGQASGDLLPLLYEVADDRDLPGAARDADGRMAWRLRARHRLHEPETPVDRASDEQVVALVRACRSARDRLIVLLMARAGLRRGELCGLRRSDVHLVADSRPLGCEVARAHLHVIRREGNPNGAWAKSRRQRAVPLDFLVVQAFDTYELERMSVPEAAASDFVFVNLSRGVIGAPVRPDAVGELLAAASRRAGLAAAVTAHQLRHAFGSNAADAGCGIDVVADLLGHASVSSAKVYLHPDPGRLRAAVDMVPSPREQTGGMG
jgi:integrase